MNSTAEGSDRLFAFRSDTGDVVFVAEFWIEVDAEVMEILHEFYFCAIDREREFLFLGRETYGIRKLC